MTARRCPVCHGEGEVTLTGVHPYRDPGGVTVMDQPDEWTERCYACDGTGREEADDE